MAPLPAKVLSAQSHLLSNERAPSIRARIALVVTCTIVITKFVHFRGNFDLSIFICRISAALFPSKGFSRDNFNIIYPLFPIVLVWTAINILNILSIL